MPEEKEKDVTEGADDEKGDDDEEVPEVEEAPTGPTHEPFSMKIFCVAKAHQSANGLRHNDHLRYRQYCSRRLRRLRNTLRWKNGRARNKQVPFPSDFQDFRFLEFPLVCAERAWSYGVQLKADNSTSQTFQARWRLHSIRRFAKAAHWAEFLEKQCGIHADQRTQKEAEAYTAFMKGTVLLEQEKWEEALEKLLRCKKVCEQLALASDPAEAKLLKDHVLDLAPSIRQCRYRSGKSHAEDGDEDAAPMDRAGGLEGLKYRGHGLASPSEKIKEKLNKCLQLAEDTAASNEEQTSTDVIARYGEVAVEFSDLLKDIHADMITGGDTEGGPALSEDEWQLIEAFAREMSICLNVQRNLVLLWNHLAKLESIVDISSQDARKNCRPEEGMRFCDLLKEDLQNLRDLPKTSSSISETLGKYEDIAKNCRCLFLALCQILMNKPLESAALLDNLHSRTDVEVAEKLEEPLGRLHSHFQQIAENFPARVTQWRCRVLAQLCSKPKAKPQEQDRLDAAGTVVFPPRVQDIPCKPLLFDLAFPCIEGPNIDQLLPKNDGQKGPGLLRAAAGATAGVASRIGGWFGRKQ